MKYRILTDDELQHLEEDFKHFLVVNGIHTEAWEEMNKENTSQAIELVEIFSDTVLQKVYEKIQYLEFRDKKSCLIFHCGKDHLELISIQNKDENTIDLSTPEFIHEALKHNLKKLDFFSSKKEYTHSREEDIHTMIEQGCSISSKEFWEILNEVIFAN